MARQHLLFIFSSFIAGIGFSQKIDTVLVADTTRADTIGLASTPNQSPDSASTTRQLISVGLSTDLGKVLSLPLSFETKYEGSLDLTLSERYIVLLEVGKATLEPKNAYTNGIYKSNGTYYRLGAGYLTSLDPKHHIGLSFRIGKATFSETGRIFLESPSGIQSEFIQTIERNDLSASWWEAVIYSDKKLLPNSDLLWLGLNIRLRVLVAYDAQSAPDIYVIPGYGRSFDKSIPAANFFLKIKF